MAMRLLESSTWFGAAGAVSFGGSESDWAFSCDHAKSGASIAAVSANFRNMPMHSISLICIHDKNCDPCLFLQLLPHNNYLFFEVRRKLFISFLRSRVHRRRKNWI